MKNWKTTIVSPETTIRKAIEVIESSKLKISFVVDNKNILIGSITDGDIRRGILNEINLDNMVTKVMNSNPLSAKSGDSKEIVLNLMKRADIRQVPLIDEHGRICSVEHLSEYISKDIVDNTVILMAGGLGNRLNPLTNNCPKPLLKIGDKPLLETIIESFIEQGFVNFYISVNYKAEMIQEYFKDGYQWGVNIKYLHESKRMGTAGALGLLKVNTTKPIIVINGDLLVKVDFSYLLNFHEENNVQATMCVREYDMQIPYGVISTNENNQILSITEKPIKKYFINAGIYVLQPEVLDIVPKNSNFDMPMLFEALIKMNSKTIIFPIKDYWMDIGEMENFLRAQNEYHDVFK